MNEALRAAIEHALGATVVDGRPVGGGSIASASRLQLDDGRRVFLKVLTHQAGDFSEEAAGLSRLRAVGALRVPEVLAHGSEGGTRFLLLEWIASGRSAKDYSQALGRGLAQLHRDSASDRCGLEHDNHIGATPQPNHWGDDWIAFWRERRLGYQLALAQRKGVADGRLTSAVQAVIDAAADIAAPTADEPMSLLHGDLWSGNVMTDEGGSPVLIDPAIYFGHREAELGMTRLFGGFGENFYRAYDAAWPLAAGWRERLPLYALYHALNHLNLFGGGYYDASLGQAERALAVARI